MPILTLNRMMTYSCDEKPLNRRTNEILFLSSILCSCGGHLPRGRWCHCRSLQNLLRRTRALAGWILAERSLLSDVLGILKTGSHSDPCCDCSARRDGCTVGCHILCNFSNPWSCWDHCDGHIRRCCGLPPELLHIYSWLSDGIILYFEKCKQWNSG